MLYIRRGYELRKRLQGGGGQKPTFGGTAVDAAGRARPGRRRIPVVVDPTPGGLIEPVRELVAAGRLPELLEQRKAIRSWYAKATQPGSVVVR